jgi:competence protein ComEA
VLGLLLSGVLISGCGGREPAGSVPIVVSTPDATATPSARPTAEALRIHVSGAVNDPDQVYRLPAGSIVADAIEAAGGATDEADLARINLAQELADQQHVHVPAKDEENPPPAVSGGEGASGLININTATQAELETLPGIGPAKAGDIVAYREASGPFGRIEDIQNVPGIGPATFEGMRDLITVE